MTEKNNADMKVIFALSLIHFVGDFYISFINPLLPVFEQKFVLSLAQVGLITGTVRILAFIVQPGVGYFSDRYPSRFFVIGGPILCLLFISLIGRAHSYVDLLLFIGIGSIGSAMFHPATAGMIANYAGRHFGLAMSLFNMGGTLAFGVGPLAIAWFVGRWGLEATLWTAIPGLVAMALVYRITPRPIVEGVRGQGFSGAIREAFGEVWKAVLLIWSVGVLRALVAQSFLTFVPILYDREGHSLVSIGLVISLFTVAGAVSGLLFGHVSDRIGYKPIFYATFGLASPSLLLMLFVQGKWVQPCAALAGFLIFATLPLGMVMAQKLAPKGKSMVSSLMLGLTQGVGGVLVPLVGGLADRFSIRGVLFGLALIPLLSIGLVWFFPEERLREEVFTG